MERFRQTFRPGRGTQILDIGGDPYNWGLIDCPAHVTLLNLRVPDRCDSRFTAVVANALAVPFRDGTFDIVYSNSVIEHVGERQAQRQFAEEARRVGRHLWIQTPNRNFWVEPHLLTPFIHFFPPKVRLRMIRHWTVWGLLTRPERESIVRFVRETHLLDRKDLASMFPDSTVTGEKFLGATKSLVAIR